LIKIVAKTNERLDNIDLKARRSAEKRTQSYREQAVKILPRGCGLCARTFDGCNLQSLEVHYKNGNHADNPSDGSSWQLLGTYRHEHERSKLRDMVGRSNSRTATIGGTSNSFSDLKAMMEAKRQDQLSKKIRLSPFGS
jgi:hypothetical protein